MREKSLIIIRITILIAITIICGTIIITQNTNETTNNTTINNTTNNTTLNNTTEDNNTKNSTSTKNTAKAKTSNSNSKSSGSSHITYNPEANGEYVGVGEGVYKNRKTGKIYTQFGSNDLVRRSDLDKYY